MDLLRFKVGDVAGSSYMSRSIYQPLAVHGLFAGQPGGGPPHVHLAIEESYALSRSALLAPTFLPATEPRWGKKYTFAPNTTGYYCKHFCKFCLEDNVMLLTFLF